jgi:hypothetical protein
MGAVRTSQLHLTRVPGVATGDKAIKRLGQNTVCAAHSVVSWVAQDCMRKV